MSIKPCLIGGKLHFWKRFKPHCQSLHFPLHLQVQPDLAKHIGYYHDLIPLYPTWTIFLGTCPFQNHLAICDTTSMKNDLGNDAMIGIKNWTTLLRRLSDVLSCDISELAVMAVIIWDVSWFLRWYASVSLVLSQFFPNDTVDGC